MYQPGLDLGLDISVVEIEEGDSILEHLGDVTVQALAPYVITYYLSDRAESVDFRNLWSKKQQLFLKSVYCFMWYFIKYFIISRGVCCSVFASRPSVEVKDTFWGGGGVLCWESILHFISMQ